MNGVAGTTSGAGESGAAADSDAGRAGVGGSVGVAGSAGVGGSAGSGGSPPLVESEPNESGGAANLLPLETEIHGTIGSTSDRDFFDFEVPASPAAGGYVIWAVTNVDPWGEVTAYVYSAFDNSEIDSRNGMLGSSVIAQFPAVAGGRYRIQVTYRVGGTAPFDYALRADYYPVPDGYEPNDGSSAARRIEIGAPISAFVFAGHSSALLEPAAYQDWYAFEAEPGQIDLSISQVPADVRITARFHDTNLATMGNPFTGSDVGVRPATSARTVTTSGTHYLSVGYFYTGIPLETKDIMSSPTDLPDHYTTPYEFTIRRLTP